MPSVRHPVVAGKFYPLHADELTALISDLLPVQRDPSPAVGVMVPHAGYVYSGACAGRTLARVELPRKVLLLGPNHTGRGAALAAGAEDQWRTPLGPIPLDSELLDALGDAGVGVVRDAKAHYGEHCLEVQLPLLQALRSDLSIAPLLVRTSDLSELLALGKALSEVLEAASEPVILLISSDMTHYEPAESAAEKDRLALGRLLALDPEGLHEVVRARRISMCGAAPAVAAVEAMRRLGATGAEEVCYTHSGLVTGDDRDVVAYAGVVFH